VASPETRLRVLFVNENIGGHATVHAGLRRAFADHPRVAAEFLDVPSPGVLGRVLRLPVPGLARLDLDLQPLRAQLERAAWVRRVLRRRLRRADVDVVHLYTQNAGLLAVPALSTVPFVVSTDSTNTLNAYRLPYRHPTRFTPHTVPPSAALERRVLAAARTVVANSRFVARSLREDYAVPDEKMVVLPFGVHLPPRPANRPDRRPTVVFVGHQLERKGGLRLLDLYVRHLRLDCQLVLVTGEQPPQVPEGVRVVGDVAGPGPRLWQELAAADVMCFPSTIDQAPNVVLEAAAAGLPVIAHPVGAIPEMVVDGLTGLLVPPDDDALLVEALRALLGDAGRRRAMGRAARLHAERYYDMTSVGDRLAGLLTRAAA
jgi:starch synthase